MVGAAIHRYGMIRDGDRMLVAVSGGKDSMTALWILQERLRRIPIRYELIPVYLEMGYAPATTEQMEAYFRAAGYAEYRVESLDYAVQAHSEINRENPCFLCSWLRRKRLFATAVSMNCNKLVLGHNQDDMIETLFLNIFYGSTISTLQPVQPLFGGKITIVRPLTLVPEEAVRRFAEHAALPLLKNSCPSAKNSKRTEIRNMLAVLYKSNRKIRGNIFHAIHNVNLDYLPGNPGSDPVHSE